MLNRLRNLSIAVKVMILLSLSAGTLVNCFGVILNIRAMQC